MRKLIISFCLLVAAMSIQAIPLKGIRIESAGQPILVFVNDVQMCTASNSCFVANLSIGNYKVEVYAATPGRRGETGGRKGERLYSERVQYWAKDIHHITIDSHMDNHPGDRRDRDDYRDVMRTDDFNRFLKAVKDGKFDSERNKLIETSLYTTGFTSDQCLRLRNLYTFDSEILKLMKMMYPNIVDKNQFFVVIESLTFPSSKTEISDFIRKYHGK